MNKINVWWLAIRPKTLGAGIAPVIVGTAMSNHLLQSAGQGLSLWIAFLCFAGAALLQIESNLVNDYFDFVKGSDTQNRLGPTRVTSAGLVTPKQMQLAIVIVAIMSLILGTLLIFEAGLVILAIGVVSLLFAFAYTAGPWPLAHLGLGDIFVFLFFGPVAVAGTVYAQTKTFSEVAVLASLPIGLLAVAILLVNNLRDFEEDRSTNKKTIIVRFGKKFGETFYALIIVLTPVYIFLMSLAGVFPFWCLLVGLAGLTDRQLVKDVLKANGAAYNPLLARTSKRLVIVSLLFSLGWLL